MTDSATLASPLAAHLVDDGAIVRDSRVQHFGDPPGECLAARDGLVVCDLSHFGSIAATGADADSFLQGQLSSDIRQLTLERAQYGSYNTPKGRMLASLLLYRSAAAIHLQLPRELVEPIRKRLSMFILRAKAALAVEDPGQVRLGVAGTGAEALVAAVVGHAPVSPLDVAQADDVVTIRLPGDRFEIVATPEKGLRLWQALAATARPVGAPAWDWLEIQAGVPVITAATQEQFVPQMVNFDLIGGVSFQKGCYPGQEIVARTHYLGKLKRRMYLAHVADGAAPAPGTELYSDDLDGQASGMVVNAAAAPGHGFDLLAVIQTASAASRPIHVGAPDGPTLALADLPYPVP
ncbi:MAG: folate-binding protein YgfZ [Burkholderiales bacterium]